MAVSFIPGIYYSDKKITQRICGRTSIWTFLEQRLSSLKVLNSEESPKLLHCENFHVCKSHPRSGQKWTVNSTSGDRYLGSGCMCKAPGQLSREALINLFCGQLSLPVSFHTWIRPLAFSYGPGEELSS